MICAIFYPNFDEYQSVCMNFVGLAKMRVEMYVGSVGWRPPGTSPRTDAGENLQVAVGCPYVPWLHA